MNRHQDEGWKGKLIHVSGFLNFLDSAIQELVGPSDLIIFQRNIISPRAFDSLLYWQGMGKPVVIDLDDAYQDLPWCNPAHNFWLERDFPDLKGEPRPGAAIEMLEEGVRISDGLIAPNRNLLADWEYVSGNSYYLQNYAEPDWWTDLPDRSELKAKKGLEDRIIIGWGGSLSHYDSWWGAGIREAASLITKRHPEILWMICGGDNRIVGQLDVPRENKIHQQGVGPEIWPQIVKHFDIGIAPLTGPYDQRRSWIKGLEYNLAGVPWVGIAGETYDSIGDTGLLGPETPEFWEDSLERLLANLPAIQEQKIAAIPEMQERFFADSNLDKFSAVYRQIKSDFIDNHQGLPGVFEVVADEEKTNDTISTEKETPDTV